MIEFTDEKKKKTVSLPKSLMVDTFRSMTSGATYPMKHDEVDWVEIEQTVGLRQPPRNSQLGAVITKPNDESFLLETVWEDHKDNDQADGDITLFIEKIDNHFHLERLTPKEAKKRFPEWDGYHHGDKNYLK